jgi:hypothetical protein
MAPGDEIGWIQRPPDYERITRAQFEDEHECVHTDNGCGDHRKVRRISRLIAQWNHSTVSMIPVG